MRASALGRLLWRPFSLWNAVVSGGLAVVAGMVTGALRGAMTGGSVAARQAHWGDFVQVALVSVVLPMAVGTVAGWAAFEFLLCPVAASAPGVGRRIRAGLARVGLVASGLTSLLVAVEFGGSSIPLFLASGLCWFAVGVLWVDPLTATWKFGRWVVWPLVIVPIVAAPEIVTFLRAWPIVSAALALLLGGGAFSVPFRRVSMRRRVTETRCVDHHAYRPGGVHREAWARASWNPGRALNGARDWTRAALHEAFGTVPGGWPGALIRGGLAWAFILVFMEFVLAGTRKPESATLAGTVLDSLWNGGSRPLPILLILLSVWGALLFVQSPHCLGGTSGYPVSRRLRAEVAWRSSLIQSIGILVPLALGTALVCETLFWFTEVESRPSGLPFYLRPMIAMTLLAPLPQAFHLHFVSSRAKGKWSSPQRLGLVSFALGLPTVALSVVWELAAPHTSMFWELGLAVVAFVLVQRVWRRRIERHFRTQDLA